MKSYQITAWSHELFKLQVTPGGVYIDATMGNGYDTQFLCEMAGETGKVWAFDIQEQALKATKERLEKHGLLAKAELILDSHTQMEQYVKPDSVDGIYFNFGYLPGGDHELATKADTSVQAVETGLRLLKPGGVMGFVFTAEGIRDLRKRTRYWTF